MSGPIRRSALTGRPPWSHGNRRKNEHAEVSQVTATASLRRAVMIQRDTTVPGET